ncbi:hypothetical protein PPYR_03121 [Photinus pyralis]|uniref:Uncharacterized protein n=2 Tax=Photinus pyralis TaxID=7054 RepID=A0A5N4A200_PHOPY|nr:uncharacterized protein LOC116161874 [Photinus pyralis]KAB0791321.1 hypothetical protein PPYR_03121 [Photinus pyralis]
MALLRVWLLCLLVGVAVGRQVPSEAVEIWNEAMGPYREQCASETNVDLDTVATMFSEASPIDDGDHHCYVHCVFQQVNFISAEGEFDSETIQNTASFLNEDQVGGCVSSGEEAEELCEKSYRLFECIIDAVAED